MNPSKPPRDLHDQGLNQELELPKWVEVAIVIGYVIMISVGGYACWINFLKELAGL